MKWDVAEKRGNDLVFRICVTPEICAEKDAAEARISELVAKGKGLEDAEKLELGEKQQAVFMLTKQMIHEEAVYGLGSSWVKDAQGTPKEVKSAGTEAQQIARAAQEFAALVKQKHATPVSQPLPLQGKDVP